MYTDTKKKINNILKELGFHSASGNPTHTHSSLSKENICQNHMLVLNIFNIINNLLNQLELLYLYWIPKLHKNPYKQPHHRSFAELFCESLSDSKESSL